MKNKKIVGASIWEVILSVLMILLIIFLVIFSWFIIDDVIQESKFSKDNCLIDKTIQICEERGASYLNFTLSYDKKEFSCLKNRQIVQLKFLESELKECGW